MSSNFPDGPALALAVNDTQHDFEAAVALEYAGLIDPKRVDALAERYTAAYAEYLQYTSILLLVDMDAFIEASLESYKEEQL